MCFIKSEMLTTILLEEINASSVYVYAARLYPANACLYQSGCPQKILWWKCHGDMGIIKLDSICFEESN